ncbi:MAG: hypothetical protein ACTHOJ_15585 [Sphingomonas oligoaromativorans]
MSTTLNFSPKAIWGLSAIVVLGLPVTSWLYWPEVLEAGVLSPDADSIIIPMFESAVLAALLSPVVGMLTWLCTRRRTSLLDLTAWRSDRPVMSGFVTACAALPFAFGLFLVEEEITAPYGWYGWIWLPYTLAILLWLAFMRAAALQKRTIR